MALQSSGQITLAEVRNEFFGNTGTTQFAISGLYGKGNAPASSGEIQLAADFYGTSNTISITATITCAQQNSTDSASNPASAMGSTTNNNITGGGVHISFYERQASAKSSVCTGFIASGSRDGITQLIRDTRHFVFQMSTASTGWTKITITPQGSASSTFNRTSADTSDNKTFIWQTADSGVSDVPGGNTMSFVIS
jgi:hypothetical protein